MNSINVVITCTDRKQTQADPSLMARTLRAKGARNRASEWIKRLKTADTEVMPAEELYQGPHWHVVKSIAASAKKMRLDVTIWVMSAGYGLISINSPIRAYSATFSPSPDRVTDSDELAEWWHKVSKWKGPVGNAPRTLAEVARRKPHTPMLVAASAPYIRAVADDLLQVQRTLSPQRLGVISAGLRFHPDLDPSVLPCDGRFLRRSVNGVDQGLVDGTMHTLNAKLAKFALETFKDWKSDVGILRSRFAEASGDLPQIQSVKRMPSSTADVTTFISQRSINGKRPGYTVLLREFRSSGKACEQHRFKLLYNSILERGQQ